MVTPNKKLGQNFLQNDTVVDLMVNSLNLLNTDTLVEVGPGLGVLTQKLSFAKKIYAIELDTVLAKDLQNKLPQNFEVINADFLRWFPNFDEKNFKLIGSLPYYITSPILHTLIKREFRPQIAVLMVQKEVAEKVCASSNDGSYLSSFVQTFFDVQFVTEVSRQDFYPVPEVDSAVIKFVKKESPAIAIEHLAAYEKFLHHVHKNPRKMLNKVFTKDQLVQLNIDGSLRPQNISVDMWVEIFHTLHA